MPAANLNRFRLLINPYAAVSLKAICSRNAHSFKHVELNYVSIPAEKTQYAKSPLVILHGLFGHTGNWMSMAKALHHRLNRAVVLVDLRNHGSSPHTDHMSYESMALDVEMLIRKLCPTHKKCILLGHSMGGKVACQLALTQGELLEKLIVEDIVPRSTIEDQKTDMMPFIRAMKNITFPHDTLIDARRGTNADLEKLGIEDETIRSFLLTNLVENDGRIRWKMNISAIESFIHDLYGFPVDSLLKTFAGPSLFVFGLKSPFYRGEEDDWFLAKLFRNCLVKRIEDCGHWLHFDKPKEFLDITVDFVEKT